MQDIQNDGRKVESEGQDPFSKKDFHFRMDDDMPAESLPGGAWRIYFGSDKQYSIDLPADAPGVLKCAERNALLDRFAAAGGDAALLREYHTNLYDTATREILQGKINLEWNGMTRQVALGITGEEMRNALRELFEIDQKYNNQHTLRTSAMASASCLEIPKYHVILKALGQ